MLPLRIALRYLWGSRGLNAAPLLSRISMLALAVGSAAMVCLFSVFNGFDKVIGDLYTAFYSDIQVTPARGKFISFPQDRLAQMRACKGVAALAPVIEDNVLLHNEDEQLVVTLRGIGPEYYRVNNLHRYIVAGRDTVTMTPGLPTAITGMHIAARFGLSVDNNFNRLEVYYPNAAEGATLNPMNAFNTLELKPDGIFKVQEDFDARYVLAPIEAVQELLGRSGQYSSFEIKLAPGANEAAVRKSLASILGPDYKIETRAEQNHTLASVMRSEKWATYVILLFILLIASVNMIGAMSLLVLEKARDLAILTAMGIGRQKARAVFLLEGILWAAVGGGGGLLLGMMLCLAQQRWGLVKLSGDFVIDAYPVDMRGKDFCLVAFTVLAVGLLAAIYPSIRAGRRPAGNAVHFS